MMRDGGRGLESPALPEGARAAGVDPRLLERLESIEERLETSERERHEELVEIEGRIAQALAARFRDEIAAIRAEVGRASSRP